MKETLVYFVRHAEAQGNVEEFFQGKTDCEISAKGKLQLDALAERFKDITFDRLYSSPLKRAVSTAEAVNRFHDHTIITNDDLTEINAGVFEGVKWSELPVRYPHEYNLWVNDLAHFEVEGGESMVTVYERIKRCITEIVSDNIGKTIVIVSHGCALRNYLTYAEWGDIGEIGKAGWLDNTAVSLLRYDENITPEIVFKNDTSHLPPELSTLRTSKWCRYEEENDK